MGDLRQQYLDFRDSCLSSSFQKKRHLGSLKADGTPEEVLSLYLDTFQKATWNVSLPVKFPSFNDSTPDEKEGTQTVVFKTPGPSVYHGLTSSHYVQKLPAITFAEGYEGRWKSSPLINSFVEARLVFNDVELQTLDPTYLKYYTETMVSDQKALDSNVGNCDFLQTWSASLPSYTTSLSLPWFYSQRTTSFFPLYLCSSMDRLEHVFKIRRGVESLLQVRPSTASSSGSSASFTGIAPVGGDGTAGAASKAADTGDVKLSEAIKSGPLILPYPEMWGDMVIMTEDEADAYRCADAHTKLMITDVKKFEMTDATELGKTVTVKFEGFNYPVHLVYWSAKRQGSDDSTTIDGRGAVQNSTLKAGKLTVFEKFEAWQTERHYPSARLVHPPRTPGIHSWSFSNRADDSDAKSGVIVAGGEVSAELVPAGKDTSRYVFQVHAVYTKEIEFSGFPTNDTHRRTLGTLTTVAIRGDT